MSMCVKYKNNKTNTHAPTTQLKKSRALFLRNTL